MSGERQRISCFLHAVEDAAAERLELSPAGTVVLTPSLPRVWDGNFLRVRDPEANDAGALAGEAERWRVAAGLDHQTIVVGDERQAAALDGGFRALGFDVDRLLLMARHRAIDREPASVDVREVELDALADIDRVAILAEPWGDEDVVGQIHAHDRLIAEAVKVRCFGAFEGERVVSTCRLYSHENIGQVEDVSTLPSHRGHGLARAVIAAALRAASEDDHDLVFLVADADDWPRQLYHKLGFDPLGLVHRFRLVVTG